MPINFIDSNPAMEEFRKQQKFDQDSELSEQNQLEKLTTWPTRLRKMTADTDLAEIHVGTARDEAPYAGPLKAQELRGKTITNDRGGVSLEGERAELPYKGPAAAENLRGKRISNDEGDLTLDVNRQTAPNKVRRSANETTRDDIDTDLYPQTAGTRLRQASATATNTEAQGFYKSIELLGQGRDAEAQAVAAQTGHTIPDAVLQNSDLRTAVVAAANRAKELYPNRPRDQQAYINGKIESITSGRQNGERVGRPDQTYQMPPNAPQPPEQTNEFRDRWQALPANRRNPETGETEQGYIKFNQTDGSQEFITGTQLQGKAGSGGNDPAAVRTAKWLVDQKIAPDMATGYQMARAGVNDSTQWQRLVQAEHKALTNDPEYQATDAAGKERMARQRVVDRKNNSYTVPPAPPKPPEKPGFISRIFGGSSSAPPEISMTGNGTKAVPYQPRTQEDMKDITSGTYYMNPADGRIYLKN